VCPCINAVSNSDGHCCPAGWVFGNDLNGNGLRCYLGPIGEGTLPDEVAACRQHTLDDFGQAVSAVGAGLASDPANGVIMNACGAFFISATLPTLDLAGPGTALTSIMCNAGCTLPACVCYQTCPCSPVMVGCTQGSYCVMEPLGPTVEGACGSSAQCQPGFLCSSGICVNAGHACVTDADCPSGTCMAKGNVTGVCQ
jgi:hypothetical protein